MSGSARALALLSVGAVAPVGLPPAALGAETPDGLDAHTQRPVATGLSTDEARWRLPHGMRGVRAAWTDLDVALAALERNARARPDDDPERRRLGPLLAARARLRDEGGAWFARPEAGEASAEPPRDLDARLAALAHRVAIAYVRADYAPVTQALAEVSAPAPGAGPYGALPDGPVESTTTRAGNVLREASTLAPGDSGGALPGTGGAVADSAAAGASSAGVSLGASELSPSTGQPPLPETARSFLAGFKEALFSPARPSDAPEAPADAPRASKEPGAPHGNPPAPFPWRRVLLALAAVAGAGLWLLGIRALVKRLDPDAEALERRLKRVAAPLRGPVAADVQAGGAESVFRPRERHSRMAWAWRPIARRHPLLDARRALGVAAGAGAAVAAFAWFALWALKVPGGWWTVPALWGAGGFGAWQALRWQQARMEAAFIRQFPEIVDQMVRLAGAGVPAVEALSVVAADAKAPVRGVLTEVCDALLAGLDPDRALRLATERARMAEFTLFAAVLRLQRRAGGGISGAFANLAETLRERSKSALKARAATAQTRLTLLVLSVMPVLVLIGQKFTAPESVEVLFGTEAGTTLLRVGVGLIVTGLLVARAIAARAAL